MIKELLAKQNSLRWIFTYESIVRDRIKPERCKEIDLLQVKIDFYKEFANCSNYELDKVASEIYEMSPEFYNFIKPVILEISVTDHSVNFDTPKIITISLPIKKENKIKSLFKKLFKIR